MIIMRTIHSYTLDNDRRYFVLLLISHRYSNIFIHACKNHYSYFVQPLQLLKAIATQNRILTNARLEELFAKLI